MLSVTLEVPVVDAGVKFYTDAGLDVAQDNGVARLRCRGQDQDCVVLVGSAKTKRLHHISLRAEELDEIGRRVPKAGGTLVDPPKGFDASGIWVRDPNGMLLHLVECPVAKDLSPEPTFEINAPGRIVRTRRSAIRPATAYPPIRPLRLGHVLAFSPDVLASVAFATGPLGMGLADRAQDVIAFCCARKNSDHHVLAFAKSPGIGFHHASFQVGDPDEVGRGGRALIAKAGRGDWGVGRHTIGSNFFHYIQDPWGSWMEYYADMDFIDDYALWTPTNYGMEDSLASWGPTPPKDFVHNYEIEGVPA
jgi:catechol 2,3-dioxygenase